MPPGLALLPGLRRVNLAWNRFVGCALTVLPTAGELPRLLLPSSSSDPLNRARATRGGGGTPWATAAAAPLALVPVLNRGLSARQSARQSARGGGNSRSAARGLAALVVEDHDSAGAAPMLPSLQLLGESVVDGGETVGSTPPPRAPSCLAGAKPLAELYLSDNPRLAFPKGAACFGRRACRALAALRMVF